MVRTVRKIFNVPKGKRQKNRLLVCYYILCLILLVTLMLLGVKLKTGSKQSMEEIYEICYTYSAGQNVDRILYMVCDPPKSDEDLLSQISSFLSEQKVDELLDRLNPSSRGMDIVFLEPSRSLGVGVFPKEGESILDYHPEENVIAFSYLEATSEFPLEVRVVR